MKQLLNADNFYSSIEEDTLSVHKFKVINNSTKEFLKQGYKLNALDFMNDVFDKELKKFFAYLLFEKKLLEIETGLNIKSFIFCRKYNNLYDENGVELIDSCDFNDLLKNTINIQVDKDGFLIINGCSRDSNHNYKTHNLYIYPITYNTMNQLQLNINTAYTQKLLSEKDINWIINSTSAVKFRFKNL